MILPTVYTLRESSSNLQLIASVSFAVPLNIPHRARISEKNNSKAQREERERRQFND